MASTVRFLGRLALIPVFGYAMVTALEYTGIAGAEGEPAANGCEHAADPCRCATSRPSVRICRR